MKGWIKNGLKDFFLFLSKHSVLVRNYYLRWSYITPDTIGLAFINFVFQRILRNNHKVNFPVHFTSRVAAFDKIKLHRDRNTIRSFARSGGCYIQANNGLELGGQILFGPGVKIISSNHDFSDYSSVVKQEPIRIGDNVWIGSNAVILPSVEIGNNCVIGAGAVVTKSFKGDNLVIAGNPARIVKRIGEKANYKRLKER